LFFSAARSSGAIPFLISVLALLNHLLNFALPALVVALLLSLGATVLHRKAALRYGFWKRTGVLTLAGVLVLFGGLVYFGRDGKMATYVALVLACGTCQWWMLRKAAP
jgi:hypothetical protein